MIFGQQNHLLQDSQNYFYQYLIKKLANIELVLDSSCFLWLL